MRYATWNFALIDGLKTTPVFANGITFLDEQESIILGYLNDDADMSMAEIYTLSELTQEQALKLLTAKVSNVTVGPDGFFIFANDQMTELAK